MLTKLCNWQRSAQWPLLSRRKRARSFHHSSGVHGNSHKHLRLLGEINVEEYKSECQQQPSDCYRIFFWSNVCFHFKWMYTCMYRWMCKCYKLWFVDLWGFACHFLWCLSSLTNNLTLFRVGDLHYRIWAIILRNRLQVSPLLSVSETQKHGGGFPGCSLPWVNVS